MIAVNNDIGREWMFLMSVVVVYGVPKNMSQLYQVNSVVMTKNLISVKFYTCIVPHIIVL